MILKKKHLNPSKKIFLKKKRNYFCTKFRDYFSISFVGVWEKPLDVLPNFDNRFAKDLFGAPYDTFNGFTPDGYVVAIENKPFPMVVLSSTRLVIKAKDRNSLQQYMETLQPKIVEFVHGNSFSSFGINSEYQWTDINESSEVWLWKHFINPSLSDEYSFQMCNKLNLRIGINESQVANVEIEPRRGIRNGIFANINHHHNQILNSIPIGEEAKLLIESSIKTIEERIIKRLIENER